MRSLRLLVPASAATVLALAVAAREAAPSAMLAERDVVTYLKAYLHEDVRYRDGRPFTSPVFAEDSINGLARIPLVDERVRALVQRVVREDLQENFLEYAARKHIALAETVSAPLDVPRIQARVWSIFLDDPRWLRRVLLDIYSAARRESVGVTASIPLPDEAPLTASEADVRTMYATLMAYKSPENAEKCARNPLLAFRELKGQDPLLAARLYELTLGREAPLGVEAVIRHLESGGWSIRSS